MLRPGAVLPAPPDRHLVVDADATLALTRTELVHFVRPFAHLLFESLAASIKARSLAGAMRTWTRRGELRAAGLR